MGSWWLPQLQREASGTRQSWPRGLESLMAQLLMELWEWCYKRILKQRGTSNLKHVPGKPEKTADVVTRSSLRADTWPVTSKAHRAANMLRCPLSATAWPTFWSRGVMIQCFHCWVLLLYWTNFQFPSFIFSCVHLLVWKPTTCACLAVVAWNSTSSSFSFFFLLLLLSPSSFSFFFFLLLSPSSSSFLLRFLLLLPLLLLLLILLVLTI